jgi:HD-GYP domain-containing protein (c-di-GMP phosphodiesterase class II)
MNSENKENRELYNSRIVDNYIKLIRSQYSYIDIEELLSQAGMEPYQVEDEGHWFTQEQINRFHERLREVSGNRNIAREAGKYAASPDALGVMRQYILGLIGPKNVYELAGTYASRLTRSSVFEAKALGSNRVEIVVTPNKGVKERQFQCENRIGFFDAIATAFNYNLPDIEHPECLFKGGNSCRYIISWEKSPYAFWKRTRDYIAILCILISFVAPFVLSPIFLIGLFLLELSVLAFVSFVAEKQRVKELDSAVKHLSLSAEKLVEQVHINHENSLMINEIGQALSKESELNGILSSVTNVLENRLDFDRGLILLANSDKTRLISRAGFGYNLQELSKFMLSKGFHLDKKDSRGVFINCFHEQIPFLVNDINEIKDDLSTRSLDFAIKTGVKSFVCCPIVYEEESLGVLAVDNIKTKKTLVQRDINVLMGIAPQIAVAIHNIKLVEARIKQFQSILLALVASTEARDPITAGHSEKVTEYAVGICQELRLPSDYTDMIRVSASLHDYGKIGVDDAILKKPGRLDDNEYEHIKTHVDKTKKILNQVNFEGVYKEVPEIAASHHEKIDGTGYPRGLNGDQIPLGGKIIAVADVFEALTSRRHYRDPMPINEAFDHVVERIGTHFDESCVEAFIEYYNKNEAAVPYIPKKIY